MNFLKSFVYAARGILYGIRGRNFRVQLGCAFVAIFAGLYFQISPTEWIIICGCIGAVLSAELLNTAIELLCDHIHPTKHPQIGRIKDLSAGAVLILATVSLVIALIIFIPKFL